MRRPHPRALTRLDWMILRALRAAPDVPLREVAQRVGITPRTLGKRYGILIRDDAALFVPVLSPASLPGVVARFILHPRPEADRAKFFARARALPRLMDAFDASVIVPAPNPLLDVWLHVPNATAAEDAQREMLDWPDVESVELVFPVRQAFFTSTIDEALEAREARAAA